MKNITIVLLFFTNALMAQSSYFSSVNQNIPIVATGINSMDVESADVDGDGDLDIAVAGEYSRNLLLFNDGTGIFQEDPSKLFPKKDPSNPFGGQDSEDIAFADFDLDGDIDLFFATEDTPFHELLLNDGTGKFSLVDFNFSVSNGNAVAILDLNADDYPDIIIGNTGQNEVYLNNQDLTFTKDTERWPYNTEGTQDLKLVDLDGDGDLDVIEGIDAGSNNILINKDGFFSEENERLPTSNVTLETRKIALGDANGDGHPDIFVATVNFTGLADLKNRLYFNDGNGFFIDASYNLPVLSEQTLDAVFLDYDLDNDLDLITVAFLSPGNNYRAYENDGNGQFSLKTAEVFDSFSLSNGIALHAADFNQDGFFDLYLGGFQETDDLLLSTNIRSSTNEQAPNIKLELYPNPSHQFLQISVNQNFSSKSSVFKIYNLKGELLQEIASKAVLVDGHNYQIDVSNFANGVYYLTLEQNGKKYASTEFEVMR